MAGLILLEMLIREMEGMTTIKQARVFQLICFFGLMLAAKGLFGQQKDFGSWWEFEMSGRFKNDLKLSGELEQRFKENSLQFDRTLLTVAGDYDVTDYLNLTAGIRTIFITDPESRIYTRFRLHTDATGHYDFDRTELSFRLRFQYGFDDIFFIGYFSENNFVSRQRIKVAHDFFGTRLGIFSSLENWIRFTDRYGRPLYKIRWVAGTQYNLGRQSRIRLRYIFESEFNSVNPLQIHVLAFGYTYSF
jgi:hypothetical protein